MALLATLFLAFLATVSQPAHAYLSTGWSPSPTISDRGNDAGGGGENIAGIWYAKDTSSRYFLMDLAGSITSSDHADSYGIILNIGPNAVMVFPLGGKDFLHSSLYGDFDLFNDIGGVVNNVEGSFPAAIPNAVWLVSSGFLGLVGLQRRRGRKGLIGTRTDASFRTLKGRPVYAGRNAQPPSLTCLDPQVNVSPR